MPRRLFGGILVLALLAGVAGTSAAQETGTPIFKAPYRAFDHHEIGASLSDPGEGVGAALEGFYRYGSGPYDFSLRGGFADFNGPGSAVLLGGDFRTQVVHYSESFPLDGSVTLGLGGVFGSDIERCDSPAGGYFAWTAFRAGELQHRSSFRTFTRSSRRRSAAAGGDDVLFALGLGVDIKFSDRWAIRASGGLGDIEGVGVSIAYLQ